MSSARVLVCFCRGKRAGRAPFPEGSGWERASAFGPPAALPRASRGFSARFRACAVPTRPLGRRGFGRGTKIRCYTFFFPREIQMERLMTVCMCQLLQLTLIITTAPYETVKLPPRASALLTFWRALTAMEEAPGAEEAPEAAPASRAATKKALARRPRRRRRIEPRRAWTRGRRRRRRTGEGPGRHRRRGATVAAGATPRPPRTSSSATRTAAAGTRTVDSVSASGTATTTATTATAWGSRSRTIASRT